MPAKLKPCPFCASRQVAVQSHAGPATVFAVRCENCAAEGPLGMTYAEAIKLWNHRPKPSGDGDGQR